jgi:TolB-like protein/tetratricopeptide (TPR) repeat protein
MIGTTVSHYKILEHLGGGGMGIVYKAQDLKLDRLVALKFLPPDLTCDPEAKQRFVHEARAASALQHHNICTIHDIDETAEGALFIVMDLYNGETLKQKIDRGALQINEAISLAVQIAQGLSEAHCAGIIHRDIKPANIFITTAGVVKILDFGLAKLSGKTLLTKTGSTMGTAAYMSPEQARGDSTDARTDIWSLGVVFYEMVSGQRPFTAEYENALIYAILNVDPKPISALRPEIPPEVERCLTKCLARNPEDRYSNVEGLVTDLHFRATGGDETAFPQEHRIDGTQHRTRRRLLVGGLAACILIVAGIVTYTINWSGDRPPPVAVPQKMIAVLPFENLGPAEDEYFAEGLTEEITSRLSAISSLGVISRTSAMQYKKTQKTLPVIAGELGVDYVLEGTVRWTKTAKGQRLRITPQLIEVAGDRHLWADNLDRNVGDIFIIQTEIANRVVEVLGIVLLGNEKGAIEAIPTKNIDAYKAFLQAGASSYYERPKLENSIAMFQRAVALDSSFALAHLGLSMAHLHYYFFGYDRSSKRLAMSKKELDRTFALQPDLPQAYAGLGFYYYQGQLNYEAALEAFELASKRLPNSNTVLAQIAYIWRRQGRFTEATDQLKKVFRLDPKGAGTVREIGLTLSYLGKFADAETFFDQAIALAPDQGRTFDLKSDMYIRWRGDLKKSRFELERAPAKYASPRRLTWIDIYERNYASAFDRLTEVTDSALVEQQAITPVAQLRGLIYRFKGDTARARMAFDSALIVLKSEIKERPEDFRLPMSLGITFAGLGRTEEALQEARRAIQLMPLSKDAVNGAFPLFTMAQVYAMVGDDAAALDQMESLLALSAPKLLTVPLLRLDPTYDHLRGYSRFQVLLAEYE